MSAAIAAGLGTDPEWPRSEDTIQTDLNRLAAELTQAADRAATVSDNETREARAELEAMTCEHLSALDVLDGHRCPCKTTTERPAA